MSTTVYPRWRGEHEIPYDEASEQEGLSPLARGTLPAGGLSVPMTRFIPAGAGNTILREHRNAGLAVYPRWRGEHLHCVGCFQHLTGLSPLARGTL